MGMSPSCHCLCPGTGGGSSGGSGSGSGSGSGGFSFSGTADLGCGSCIDTVSSTLYRADITATGTSTCLGSYNKSFNLQLHPSLNCIWGSGAGSGEITINHRVAGCTVTGFIDRVALYAHNMTADGEWAWYLWVLYDLGAGAVILGDYKLTFGGAYDCLLPRTLALFSGGTDALAHGGALTLGATCVITPI